MLSQVLEVRLVVADAGFSAGRNSCWCLTRNVRRCAAIDPIHTNMKITTLTALCLFPIVASVVSCKEKGPAEKAGENIDEAVENVKDAVDPEGPVEKVGEKIDEATGN